MFPVTFARPDLLWWLGLVLPVLFLLALPPQPRTVVWTAHLPQWLAAQRLLKRRPPRLHGVRFLLLAIAAIASVAALAGPRQPGQPGPRRLVVLLDASASMAATGTAGSAFAAARAALQRGLAGVPAHVEVTVLRLGGPLLRRHGASARALHDLGAPGGAAGVDLVALAAELATADTAVWTLTDGQGQRDLPAHGALTVCGGAVPNAAILGVQAADQWPLPALQVTVEVVAFTAGPANAVLRASGALVGPVSAPVELAPGVPATVVLSLQRTAAGGPLELDLALPGDALATDDSWRAALPPLPAPRIAVLGAADAGPVALAARAAAADALAAEVGGEVVPAVAGAAVGLLLADGGQVALVPGEVRAVCFGCQHQGAPEPTPWLQPTVADWDRDHPLTAGLDLSELQLTCAFRATLPPGEPFLWATDPGGPNVPLAVVCGTRDRASIHFGFRLQDSNLPLLPAFPQLLRRAFLRCYGTGSELQVATAPSPAGEQDLQHLAAGPDRSLPDFGTPDLDLAPLLLGLGLGALALRALVR